MPESAPYLFAGLLALMMLGGLALRFRRGHLREVRLRELLDLADALEAQLNRAERQMRSVRSSLQPLTGDPGREDLGALIREAKRDLLQHRLWIQKHGLDAGLTELETACAALRRVSGGIGDKLQALEHATADFSDATAAAQRAAEREPPSLRRP
jgi:hypothetical protein